MIEAKGLSKRYGDKLAVDQLSFTVRPGVVTGFLGPNGSGKSTTMRMIMGLDLPNAGTTTVNTLTQNTGDSTTIDTGGGTLRVGAVGGIFITPSGGNLTIGVSGTAGTLTAGGADNVPGELILENNSTANTLTINSAITDNGSGSVSVTVAGSGVTALAGTNTYSGSTLITSGTLRTDSTSAIPTTTSR